MKTILRVSAALVLCLGFWASLRPAKAMPCCRKGHAMSMSASATTCCSQHCKLNKAQVAKLQAYNSRHQGASMNMDCLRCLFLNCGQPTCLPVVCA